MSRITCKREHSSWRAMRYRCEDPKSPSFKHYGGRGIAVCQRWRDSFDAFYADMGPRPDGTTLDRIDSNGNYEPGNCQWAQHKDQHRNKRGTLVLEAYGETLTLAEWAEKVGVRADTIKNRLLRGESVQMALRRTRPRQKGRVWLYSNT